MCLSRYESWLSGEDLGHHPCDDPKTSAMTVAPPPSAEEFLVNKTNNDREVTHLQCGRWGQIHRTRTIKFKCGNFYAILQENIFKGQ